MDTLTADTARSLIVYDPGAGSFVWRVNVSSTGRAGNPAGCVRRDGRRVVRLKGRLYLASRLAFLIHSGEWPEGEVDHIDGNTANDAWHNLRNATRGQNARNAGARRDSQTGLKGASPHPCGKFQASLQHAGKQVTLGLHDTPEQAHQAYRETAQALQGEFAHASIRETTP